MRFSLLVLAALVIGLGGCSEDQTAPTVADDFTTIDFNLPYGGLTATDEDPAFGDEYLLMEDAAADEEDYEDPLAEDPEVQDLEARGESHEGPRPRFTFLRIVWGELDAPEAAEDGERVDWSGLLRVDRGIVVVRRVIRFERPTDSVVRPRIDRHTVAWFSHTGGHYDGLLIEIIEPPLVPEAQDIEPNVLHFETGPFAHDFVIEELPGLDRVVEVEPEGNAIHFVGFNLDALDPCPRGFLSGVWRDAPEGDGGGFRGRWVGLHGRGQGFMMGRFGVNDEGENVFFGKYISRSGQFRGLIAGTWGPTDEPGHGEFQGHWVNARETVEGRLGGRYLQLPERPGGFYQGRWAATCAEEDIP